MQEQIKNNVNAIKEQPYLCLPCRQLRCETRVPSYREGTERECCNEVFIADGIQKKQRYSIRWHGVEVNFSNTSWNRYKIRITLLNTSFLQWFLKIFIPAALNFQQVFEWIYFWASGRPKWWRPQFFHPCPPLLLIFGGSVVRTVRW